MTLAAIMPLHARHPVYGFEALLNMCDSKTHKQICVFSKMQWFSGGSLYSNIAPIKNKLTG